MHYDEKYFEFQKKIGMFGGKANLFKFIKEIKSTDDVLDFGCGGGFLLTNITTDGKKNGVDINSTARDMANGNGIECYESIDQVPDNAYDVVISNHALEHAENPKEVLQSLKRKLRTGGTIVIVVPHEVGKTVREDDINMHLYTWSPQNLRNLMQVCGFVDIRAERIVHAWPPIGYTKIQKVFGWKGFNLICVIYGFISRRYQTKVVAKV
jgi:2-polyprenyl-3-methyl-5-hydroxy-6-metoxy-1,4-benzoquinol methylase